VSRLAEEVGRQGHQSMFFTLNYPDLGPLPQFEYTHLRSIEGDRTAISFRGLSANAHDSLQQLCHDSQSASPLIIHNHGLWMFPNIYARLVANRLSSHLIISPRGMLERWSLSRSRLVKVPYWHLFEKKNLLSASLFHATSFQEAASIRSLGLVQPIAVIPNGVNPAILPSELSKEAYLSRFPELKDKKIALFLSRIHPKKGLEMLLDCWKRLGDSTDGWHLVIAGPDQIGYQSSLERITKDLNLTEKVTFAGILEGDLKAAAFETSTIFVLPSFSENFGIVVAEALTYKVPVVTTTSTPWSSLIREHCGWISEPGNDDLYRSLSNAMSTSSAELHEMGLRGRRFAIDNFSWDHIGMQMCSAYKWLLNMAPKPDCIVL
jgi:glycosyltransferase involved in cell wall biosynthesis